MLITTPNLDTAGSKLVIRDLIEGINRDRFTPCLGVYRPSGTTLENQLQSCVDDYVVLSGAREGGRLLLVPRAIADASTLRGRFDLVHSFDYASSVAEGLACTFARIPWICEKTNLIWKRGYFARSIFARHIVCHSEAARELFRGTPFARRTRVVPCGVNLEQFSGPSEREHLRALLPKTPLDSLYLGCVADFVPVKGHSQLLEAMSIVVDACPKLHLVLVGRGSTDYIARLREQASERGVETNVHFLRARHDVPRLMKGFDGHILPTRNTGRREAFGVANIEAMAAGRPTIATRSGGPDEVVVDGVTGWLVDPVGATPLAEAMADFYRDPEKRKRYGAAARLRVEKYYTREHMVSAYESVYQEALRE